MKHWRVLDSGSPDNFSSCEDLSLGFLRRFRNSRVDIQGKVRIVSEETKGVTVRTRWMLGRYGVYRMIQWWSLNRSYGGHSCKLPVLINSPANTNRITKSIFYTLVLQITN